MFRLSAFGNVDPDLKPGLIALANEFNTLLELRAEKIYDLNYWSDPQLWAEVVAISNRIREIDVQIYRTLRVQIHRKEKVYPRQKRKFKNRNKMPVPPPEETEKLEEQKDQLDNSKIILYD